MNEPLMVRASRAQWRTLTVFLQHGASNREVAEMLDLTEDTVKTHMRHLLAQASVPNRTALVVALWRGRLRIVPPDHPKEDDDENAID